MVRRVNYLQDTATKVLILTKLSLFINCWWMAFDPNCLAEFLMVRLERLNFSKILGAKQ